MTPQKSRRRALRAMSRIVQEGPPIDKRVDKFSTYFKRAIGAKKRGYQTGAFTFSLHFPKYLREYIVGISRGSI